MSRYGTPAEYERGAQEALEGLVTINTPAERDIILAALRLWQRTPDAAIPGQIHDISTACGAHTPLGDAEIDDLCERINAELGDDK